MTLETAIEAYAALSAERQRRFLAVLAFEATVWARNSYPKLVPDGEVVVRGLRAFNELQHRVLAHLMHLESGNEKRYPDDVLVRILFDFAGGAGCEQQLAQVFDDLYSSYRRSRNRQAPTSSGA